MAMARIDVECANCGASVRIAKNCSNRRDADSYEAWAEGQEWLCDECRKAAWLEQKRKEEAEAVEKAKTNPFGIDIDSLELGGSDKQNAWAKKILAQWLARVNLDEMARDVAYWAFRDAIKDKEQKSYMFRPPQTRTIYDNERIARYERSLGVGEEPTEAKQALVRADVTKRIAAEITKRDARYWIDHRDFFAGVDDNIAKTAAYKLKDELEPPVETSAEEAPKAEAKEAPAPKAEPKPEPKKTEWKKFAFNLQNIAHETESGILIQMPHNSAYDGFSFWTSKKLVREGRHSYEMLLSINDDMKFELRKMGHGRYNRNKVIASQEISADELAEAFGGYREAPDAPKVDEYREEIIRHTPEPLAPVEDAEADPELVR
jgi:hypothetical protein